MDRYTRHQLKHDEFQDAIENVQIFVSEHLKAIILISAAIIVTVSGVMWFKNHRAQQEAAANSQLQVAVGVFEAGVGKPDPNNPQQAGLMFPTAKAKYDEALKQFGQIIKLYPHTKAAGYAEVHMGVCQARLGNDPVAIKTLRQAAQNSDQQIAALANYALAGTLAKSGKLSEARKIYASLANHPTLTVPKSTALLAMADTYRSTEPERARGIYNEIQKEYGSDSMIAEVLKQHIASLPKPK